MLLIDTEAYIERKVLAELVLIILAGGRFGYSDQTVLNKMLDGDWIELSPSFNMFAVDWASWVSEVFAPVIVDFPGPLKAWLGTDLSYGHPAYGMMEPFFRNSPWQTFLDRQPGEFRASGKRYTPTRAEYEATFKLKSERLAYYRDTVFADVVAGITTPDLSRIPFATA